MAYVDTNSNVTLMLWWDKQVFYLRHTFTTALDLKLQSLRIRLTILAYLLGPTAARCGYSAAHETVQWRTYWARIWLQSRPKTQPSTKEPFRRSPPVYLHIMRPFSSWLELSLIDEQEARMMSLRSQKYLIKAYEGTKTCFSSFSGFSSPLTHPGLITIYSRPPGVS